MKLNSPLQQIQYIIFGVQQGSVPPLQPNVVTQITVLCSELKLVLDKVQTCDLHLRTPALTPSTPNGVITVLCLCYIKKSFNVAIALYKN
jgi:hypothetical protein